MSDLLSKYVNDLPSSRTRASISRSRDTRDKLCGAQNESKWLDDIPFEERSITSHLLRGERWFLCSAVGSEVLYCDLESPVSGLIPLTPYPFPYPCESMTLMAIEEDRKAEILCFNIALVHILKADWYRRTNDEPELTSDSRVDVWHGKVVLDEDGNTTHLHSEKLVSIPLPVYLGRPLSGVSLRRSLVAFTIEREAHDGFGTQCDTIITVDYWAGYAETGVNMDVPVLLPGHHVLAAVPRDFSPLFPVSGDRYRLVFNSHCEWPKTMNTYLQDRQSHFSCNYDSQLSLAR
ncbi:hypothetical protein Agabi119p4_3729 [Agaricus bisporus var. burnettii]|uniref:Uncharacterized protein n=1 Tax=Agaricus bisporus var. burnettii TaxID=192524 RepID=A0A8H7F592_AGABI|nr:hypothetical protein Agabi119p4_3729 [Agaricus bisporus var. burnettii]